MSNKAFLLAGLLLGSTQAGATEVFAEPSAERQAELVRLVRHDCGSCHGLSLQGGLGPALLPDKLRDKPVANLVATILGGRPGTPMPPWQQFLSEGEAQWIVMRLSTRFPE